MSKLMWNGSVKEKLQNQATIVLYFSATIAFSSTEMTSTKHGVQREVTECSLVLHMYVPLTTYYNFFPGPQ